MEKVKITTSKNKIILYVLLATILIGAAYLRLNDIRNYLVFLGDQGRDVLIVKRMIKDGDMVFIGPTASVGGFFLGPFYYYLMAPALLLSNLDPVGPAIMVALLSIITTWLCYYFGSRYISPLAGIIAATLFAVSRLVVEYARSSWNPNVLPFFSMLLIIGLAKLFDTSTRRKNLWLFVIGSCLGIIIQLHYQAAVMHLMAIAAYCIYLWREKVRLGALKLTQVAKEITLILAGALLFLGPFLAFEVYHSFPNTQNIIRFVIGGESDGFKGGQSYEFIVRDTVYRLFLRLVGGGNDTAAQIASFITVVGFLLAAYILFSRFYDYVTGSNKTTSFNKDFSEYITLKSSKWKSIGFLLITLYFIFGVSLWGFYKKSIFDYYYSYMYPLPILMFAAASSLLMQYRSRRLSNKRSPLQIVTASALGVFIGVLVWLNINSVNTMVAGMQVWRTEEVARAIIKHKADGPYNFALITPGNSDHAYRYILEIWGEKPVTIEEQVTTQLMVFCEPTPRPCEPEGNSLWEVAGFGQASIVGQWQVIGLPLYRLEHIPESKHLEGKPAQKG